VIVELYERFMMRQFIATVVACAAMVMGLGAIAASPATAAEACSMALDADRRTVYSLKDGSGRVHPFAKLIVTATASNYHYYCKNFKTNGKTVTHSWSKASYKRLNGVCGTEQLGAIGSGTYRTSGYKSSLTVPDKTCVYESYSVKYDGRWYTARFMRYNA